MFKSLKIAIIDEQHLTAVCEVLESMGYVCGNPYFFKLESIKGGVIHSIAAYQNGNFYLHELSDMDFIFNCESETLRDLLQMRDEMNRSKLSGKI